MKLEKLGNNETLIHDTLAGICVLYSYSTPVAAMLPSGRYVKTEKWHSKTTSRHINKWLRDIVADSEPQSFLDNLIKLEG